MKPLLMTQDDVQVPSSQLIDVDHPSTTKKTLSNSKTHKDTSKIKNLDGSIILNAEITSVKHSQSKTIHYKVNDEKHSINADYIIYATPPGITKK